MRKRMPAVSMAPYLIGIVLFSCAVSAQNRGPVELANAPFAPGARRLAYGSGDLQFGELRLPSTKGPHPVAIVIHGGCWVAKLGSFDPRAVALDNMRPMAEALSDAGIATWNIEYRRLGDGAAAGQARSATLRPAPISFARSPPALAGSEARDFDRPLGWCAPRAVAGGASEIAGHQRSLHSRSASAERSGEPRWPRGSESDHSAPAAGLWPARHHRPAGRLAGGAAGALSRRLANRGVAARRAAGVLHGPDVCRPFSAVRDRRKTGRRCRPNNRAPEWRITSPSSIRDPRCVPRSSAARAGLLSP